MTNHGDPLVSALQGLADNLHATVLAGRGEYRGLNNERGRAYAADDAVSYLRATKQLDAVAESWAAARRTQWEVLQAFFGQIDHALARAGATADERRQLFSDMAMQLPAYANMPGSFQPVSGGEERKT